MSTSKAKMQSNLEDDEQLQKLCQQLESKPSEGGIWTRPKVAQWIAQEKGDKKVGNHRGWDYLKKLRYSWQSPRPKHKKASEIEQEQFIQNLPLQVRKLSRSRDRVMVF